MSLIKPGLGRVAPVTVSACTTIPRERGRSRFAARVANRLRQLPAEAASGREARPPADTNRVELTGTLGSEPLLYDVGDHPVAELALVQRQPPAGSTCWFNLLACEELADTCGRELHRGDRVYVAGTLQLWTEMRGRLSVLCHRILLNRIVLLAVG